ncbi:MAG TPA: sigma-70 family RNA polymerase sigma factor [Prolixibacteraceae bacterium]|nr:sigma-70 family RNA polymerase sigma factor [Prolixibacteraceae bacterium]HPS13045.1 sigma-70 family RNA polymerase sigma factor [Prolixibacteraceae bacterium]
MKEAFLNIVTSNQGIIHKVCGMYCDTTEDREDLFQEILSQLWRSYPTFRNESKISTWMYQVSLNTAITHFKKNKRRPDRNEFSKEFFQIADDHYDDSFDEQVKLLHNAIAKLTGIEKSIVLLYLEDKKYEEVAEIIGITQNYVRVKMNRIKGKLKKLMGER